MQRGEAPAENSRPHAIAVLAPRPAVALQRRPKARPSTNRHLRGLEPHRPALSFRPRLANEKARRILAEQLRRETISQLRTPESDKVAVEIIAPRMQRHDLDAERRSAFDKRFDGSRACAIVVARYIETAQRVREGNGREVRR